MSGTEYHAEELKRREEKKKARADPHIKSEKLLTLASKIGDHDLNSKITKCKQWIAKFHEIRVVITSDPSDTAKAEKIIAEIETQMKEVEGRILQKRNKDGTFRFSIMPTIKKEPAAAAAAAATKTAEKKLLEPENTPLEEQQARSFHTMSF